MSPRYSATRNQFIPAGPGGDSATLYAANGAIAVADGTHALTKTSAAVMTLAAPSAADDGMRIVITARTAFAHAVTVTGGLGGNAADDVLTFAKVGDTIELLADNAKWVPLGVYGVVIS
jgi:hypothetical protein